MSRTPQPVVTLVKEPTPYSRMASGDTRPGTRYGVYVDGARIGYVEKTSSASYRSDNTGSPTRWGFRGYGIVWRGSIGNAHFTDEGYDCVLAYSRQSAVDQLIERHNEHGNRTA